MRQLRRRDVPAGAAITIAALVLLASVVMGREEDRAPQPTGDQAPAPELSTSATELDMEKLKRPRRDDSPPDLFTLRQPVAPVQAAAVAKPAPPPAPSAPALPFKYLGRMVDGGKIVVFLEHNQESTPATAGDTLDGTFKLESISETAVQFVYLPLGTKQILSIPAQF